MLWVAASAGHVGVIKDLIQNQELIEVLNQQD